MIDCSYIITGLAAGYNNRDVKGDVFAYHVFSHSLLGRRTRIPLRFEHSLSIGRILHHEESHRGLHIVALIDQLPSARIDSEILQKRVTGLSVGFRTESYYRTRHGTRVVTQADLMEISVTRQPANERCRFTVASKDDADRLWRMHSGFAPLAATQLPAPVFASLEAPGGL